MGNEDGAINEAKHFVDTGFLTDVATVDYSGIGVVWLEEEVVVDVFIYLGVFFLFLVEIFFVFFAGLF